MLEKSFEECLELASSLLGTHESLADLQDANDYINLALLFRPGAGRAWLIKSYIMSCLEDDPAALATAQMALQLRPDCAETHYAMASILNDMDRYQEALQMLQRAFDLLTRDGRWLMEDMYYLKGIIQDSMGEEEEAMSTFNMGLEQYPDSLLLRGGLEPLQREKMRRFFKVIDGGRLPAPLEY